MKLKVSGGATTRPLTDRVKESLFAIIQERLDDACVLDVFAGSGAFGIEALSRGAARAVFVECERSCTRAIDENLGKAKLAPRARVITQRAGRAMRALREAGESFDIIFCDPPFAISGDPGRSAEANKAFDEAEEGMLHKDGIVILRYEKGTAPQAVPAAFVETDRREYGRNILLFYRFRE